MTKQTAVGTLTFAPADRSTRRARGGDRTQPSRAITTGDGGEFGDPYLDPSASDPDVLRRARKIAGRLAVPKPLPQRRPRRGSGELRSIPFGHQSGDIDLDATLLNLVERPLPADGDIVVRERLRTRRAVVLVVDVSGSMRGERVQTAAAVVGALSAELARDDLGVVAFWSDAVTVNRLGDHVVPSRLLETLIRIPARGLTNVEFALRIARTQLATCYSDDARVLLLSDCVHNAGPDPRSVAKRLPRLDVMVDVSGEHDVPMAQDLARNGRGRLAVVRDYRQVPAALSRVFGI